MHEKTARAVQTLITRPYLNLSDEQKVSIAQAAARLMINELSGLLGDNMSIEELMALRPDFQEEFSDIAALRGLDLITTKHAKEIMQAVWDTPGISAIDYVIKSKLLEEAEGDSLIPLVDAAIVANPQAVEDYRRGTTKAIGRILGQVMKAAGGKANPSEVSRIIEERIKNQS